MDMITWKGDMNPESELWRGGQTLEIKSLLSHYQRESNKRGPGPQGSLQQLAQHSYQETSVGPKTEAYLWSSEKEGLHCIHLIYSGSR